MISPEKEVEKGASRHEEDIADQEKEPEGSAKVEVELKDEVEERVELEEHASEEAAEAVLLEVL